jgi:phage tail sheath protein FI
LPYNISQSLDALHGVRTFKGDDQLSSEWKYIPERRLALYIKENLYHGLQWTVFEPKDEQLERILDSTLKPQKPGKKPKQR